MSPRSVRHLPVPQPGRREHQIEQRRRLAQMLRQHGGTEAEPVRGRAGAQGSSQPLEGKRQLAGIELAGAADGAANRQSAEAGLGRGVELDSGHIHAQCHQRNPGLPADQQVGSRQCGVEHLRLPPPLTARQQAGPRRGACYGGRLPQRRDGKAPLQQSAR